MENKMSTVLCINSCIKPKKTKISDIKVARTLEVSGRTLYVETWTTNPLHNFLYSKVLSRCCGLCNWNIKTVIFWRQIVDEIHKLTIFNNFYYHYQTNETRVTSKTDPTPKEPQHQRNLNTRSSTQEEHAPEDHSSKPLKTNIWTMISSQRTSSTAQNKKPHKRCSWTGNKNQHDLINYNRN